MWQGFFHALARVTVSRFTLTYPVIKQ